ncbi:hypothetical protein CC85DRAFT_326070 [Cutaneotrichosporon oleaginosum]|uniref:DNA/RNA-binding domain-containing protein n=1 Tax=Cutaneotrichosporon oleaginosum TaxID=879819 RepID=A0A0J0XUN1_9TREE|nr:uncharacterized protein CC85DRAFT_326070 [Cutaneotrichosporon oleaginosum]KLT44783.1 hypothetical protein CC85DRAFT_326070 [Cutaneotrichosporon oleaginosum]TXT11923.1 hypothetical protein COLE_02333 [Cutaneotrichosporon oleaginosum]
MPPPNQRRRARGGRNRGGGDGAGPGTSSGGGATEANALGASTSTADTTWSGSPGKSAVELYKDAQAASAELKSLMQSQPPWTREADAVRQRARNTYLAVLFQHPLSPHAQTLDSLWLNTTYTLIQAYRDVVGRVEASLPPRKGKDSADLRRTLARFRQALGAEDAFYRGLIGRIVAFYRLQDRAADHLALAGVPVPEAEEGDEPPLSREEAEKKLGLVYKGLICLGDLERYKEQYSEKARRDARDGVAQRDAKFDRAVMYYEVGRGLQPDNGMAFNQLAVIDGYLGDHFHCTYHYFRALAVRQPFPGGEVNLERVLKRAFDRWRVARHEGDASPADGLEAFRRDLLVICAILFLKASTSHVSHMSNVLCEQFARSLRARKLPSETIVKTTAMAIGSHWYCRLDASRGGPAAGADPAETAKAERRRLVEDLSLRFLFTVYTALVSVTAVEVEEALAARAGEDESAIADEDDDDVDTVLALAARITAVVRRILPSLRIMSRWLKSHLEYVNRAAHGSNPELRSTIETFWTEYKRLMLGLARLFPLVQLPSLDGPLEEDVDMRGFLPLRRGNAEESVEPQRADVHPNEEQLMRIADLLVDVKLLMQTEAGASVLSDGFPSAPFVAGNSETASVSVAETEDDPVNLAMRAGLMEGSTVDDSGDDEVIMWERTTSIVEQSARLGAHGPQTTTAQDLLQNLSLAPHPPPGSGNNALPAPMLFGGDGGSIWAMSREESQKGAQRAQRTTHAHAVPWQSENQQGHRLSNPAIFEFAQPPQAQQAPQAQAQQYGHHGGSYYQQYAGAHAAAHPSSAWSTPAPAQQSQLPHSGQHAQPSLYSSQSGQHSAQHSGQHSAQHSGQNSAPHSAPHSGQHSGQHSAPHSGQPTPHSGQHSAPHSTQPSPPSWRPRPATQSQNIWGPPEGGSIWSGGQRTASSAGWGYRPG